MGSLLWVNKNAVFFTEIYLDNQTKKAIIARNLELSYITLPAKRQGKIMLLDLMFFVYSVAAAGLFLYGINCYWLLSIFLRHRRKEVVYDRKFLRDFYRTHTDNDLPLITTQLPIYNEANVVERLIKSICALDYPKNKHEIQVLDDSNDDTVEIVANLVKEYKQQGYLITHVRRPKRVDYKAGALNYGLKSARGQYVAIFDADFVPPADYLRKTIPFLLENKKLCLVQARWGHLNSNQSPLTLSQSIGIDGHFIIEQSARSWGRLFMNFNGTAGIWRKSAIDSAGGWQGDTLTEDMDLSYRAQLVGWEMKFVYDVVVPAELPASVNAFKSQQYRWAKGSIQTAKKLLPRILKSKLPLKVKAQAILHTTHYMIHPLMLTTAVLALPLLLLYPLHMGNWSFSALCIIILTSSLAPSILYMVAQGVSNVHWARKIPAIPVLMAIGVGIAFNNTMAVLAAISGKKGAFIRTPKAGQKTIKSYRTKLPMSSLVELSLSLYCVIGVAIYFEAQKYLVGPFLALYGIGFFVVGLLSILHHFKEPGTKEVKRIENSTPQ